VASSSEDDPAQRVMTQVMSRGYNSGQFLLTGHHGFARQLAQHG
jgi:hypothetical protein